MPYFLEKCEGMAGTDFLYAVKHGNVVYAAAQVAGRARMPQVCFES
jgi:hypothetical protein